MRPLKTRHNQKLKRIILSIPILCLLFLSQYTNAQVCGNGKYEGGEECDDGNKLSNDGCSSSCKRELGFDCPVNVLGQKSECEEICGDGKNFKKILPAATACDDGNKDDGDGCSSECQIETGWFCSGGSPTKQDTCQEICQDGYNFCTGPDCEGQPGQPCDDKNSKNNDGCSSDCKVEDGWYCEPGKADDTDDPTQCWEVCGDEKDFGTFDCEVAEGMFEKACIDCELQKGWTCFGGTYTKPDTCEETCGDGFHFEQDCDDGNEISGDGCSNKCEIEDGFYLAEVFDYDQPTVMTEECDGYDYGYLDCDCGDYDEVNGCVGCDRCQVVDGYKCVPNDLLGQGSLCTEECGDGFNYAKGDQCDDGNKANGDGCSSTCTIEVGYKCDFDQIPNYCYEICGDGLDYEQYGCDDGNNEDNDGCSKDCKQEDGWYCYGGTVSSPDTCYEHCGDGRNHHPDDETFCDDGNNDDLDGCSANCEIEPDFQCQGGNPTFPDVCTEVCGNGKRSNSDNDCDDGNTYDGDGCNSDCQIEVGFTCEGGDASNKDVCKEACGDGRRFTSPTITTFCDDGNNDSGDGCDADCNVEEGYECSGGTTVNADICQEVCGDGKKFGLVECDDGNNYDGDGCSKDCIIEHGYDCTGGSPTNQDTCTELCNDGFNLGFVDCDDGNQFNFDGCTKDCEIVDGWYCEGGSPTQPDTCFEYCGDGLKYQYEQGVLECDDGNDYDGDGCDSNCLVEAGWECGPYIWDETNYETASECKEICGDGIRFTDPGDKKFCDVGQDGSDADGCSKDCEVQDGWYCQGGSETSPDQCFEVCGDGMNFGEHECDDGNNKDYDGCSKDCLLEDGWDCINTKNSRRLLYSEDGRRMLTGDIGTTKCTEQCGDPYGDFGSFECDDGNQEDGDGCSKNCEYELGYECYGGGPGVSDTCYEICGDQYDMRFLACDDGNTYDNDGCSSKCEVEDGFYCVESKVEILPGQGYYENHKCYDICGDGKMMEKSQYNCDDGNLENGDGCSEHCQQERGYICYGGSPTDKDTCYEYCGDGWNMPLVSGDCDDGNVIPGDGCGRTCEVEEGWYCQGGNANTRDYCYEVCGDQYDFGKLACDDGNKDDGDGCSSVCEEEDGWYCIRGDASGKKSGQCFDVCGDGKRMDDGVTECDDGNTDDNDGCSSTCTIEPGYDCDGGTDSTPDSCFAVCGDGLLRLEEECDDGNTYDNDGCSSTCTEEPGYECDGQEPTKCPEVCGDGVNLGTQDCDDGNLVDGDGCSSNCVTEPGYTCGGGSPTGPDTCEGSDFITPSLANCEVYAALFYSTCSEAASQTPAPSIAGMTAETEKCDTGYGKCIGTVDEEDSCSWSRKLCVTCSLKDGNSYIRVQTNSLPDHCYQAPSTKPAENAIDFEVAFSAQKNIKSLPTITAISQSQLDDFLCTSKWPQSSLARSSLDLFGYTQYEGSSMSSVVGIALNGVPIFAGVSELGFDALYPKTYKGSAATPIKVDYCMGNNDYTSFYHYYSMSPCIFDGTIKSLPLGKSCDSDSSCRNKKANHMITARSAYKTLTPIGIARDGHKIYGPYDQNGALWQPCDVDICNGKIINGEYAYVTTTFFPYTVGCFAVGNKPLLQASCSVNPRKCTGADSSSSFISLGYLFMAMLSLFYIFLQ